MVCTKKEIKITSLSIIGATKGFYARFPKNDGQGGLILIHPFKQDCGDELVTFSFLIVSLFNKITSRGKLSWKAN